MEDNRTTKKNVRRYSGSDKLAIALASAGVVVMIWLFVAEKTPLTVGVLLLVMMGFAAYPIIHFVRRAFPRVLAFVAVFVIGAVLGLQGLFHKEHASASEPPPQKDQQDSTQQQTKKPQPKSAKKQQSASTGSVKGNNNTTGASNQEGNNNTSVIGNNNTVSTSPSADEIADKVAQRLGPTVKGGFHEKIDKISISMGSVTANYNIQQAKTMGVITPFAISGTFPVRVRLVGDEIKWSFKSWDDGLPIEVTDNEVTIGNSEVDRNFSENAFEVVNKQGTPLFQMIRKNPGSIQINGVFPTGNVSHKTGLPILMWVSDGTGIELESLRPPAWDVKPIFKYPSWKYPGVLASD